MHDRFSNWTVRLARRLQAAMPHAIPSSCALCSAAGNSALCDACNARFVATSCHRCRQCALPMTDDTAQRCGACLSSPRAFDATFVATNYAAPVDHLVLALKFGSRLALAPLFARLLHQAIRQQPEMSPPDIITVVPLSEKRLIERGFNQALEIARPLAAALSAPLEPKLLARTRETLMQSRLHPDERHRNIHRAFALHPRMASRVQGRHVAVVDDVMTTGETLNEIAALLKRHGASRVTNLVFARTPLK